jgi:hypothetical protein
MRTAAQPRSDAVANAVAIVFAESYRLRYCRRERERFIELPFSPRLILDMARPVDIRFEFLARGA